MAHYAVSCMLSSFQKIGVLLFKVIDFIVLRTSAVQFFIVFLSNAVVNYYLYAVQTH